MSYGISITENDLYTALRAFLMQAVDGDVIAGQDNQVAMPTGTFTVMTTLRVVGLSTNKTVWDQANQQEANGRSTEWACQLDFYSDETGPAVNNAWAFAQLVRTEFACTAFLALPGQIQPLYATDPANTTMINSEAQYQERYTLEFHAQFNPVVTTPLAFADTLTVGLVEVDAKFPPGE